MLLNGFNKITHFAKEHEDEFVQMVTKKTRTDLDKSVREVKRDLEQSQARISKLDYFSKGFMRTISRARFLMSVLLK